MAVSSLAAATPGPEKHRRARAGWLIGLLCGMAVGLWAFPPVRYTLLSQLQFAFSGDNIPWLRALDARRGDRELSRLDTAAARLPQDYLLQVGRATALADVTAHPFPPDRETNPDAHDDKTLLRLAVVAREFSSAPGSYAHLARYMMADRVRLLRRELRLEKGPKPPNEPPNAHRPPPTGPPPAEIRSIPARLRDVKLMEWALTSGEQRDPDNAFWPAMLATTYFAALRDAEGLKALERASRKARWDAYIYEEVLGQWRLYSAAYGDNGAAQKIAPLSLLAFPHLREIRRMAEIVRWYAEQAAAQGRDADAVRIRRHLAWLGLLMRDTAQWAYEALYGTDLFLIAATDSRQTSGPLLIRTARQWETQGADYVALLQKTKRLHELAWLRQEVENVCDLRDRIEIARYDASYPGIPPGIPLLPLFGNWMAGLTVIQQAGTFVLGAALATVGHFLRKRYVLPRPLRVLGVLTLCWILGSTATTLWFGVPTPYVALTFLFTLTLLFVLALEAGTQPRNKRLSSLMEEAEGTEEEAAAIRWGRTTTARILGVLLLPGVVLLVWLRPELSFLHPVAALLSNLMGGEAAATLREAFLAALLLCALPLAAVLLCAVRGLWRRVSPLESVLFGLRRLTLPAFACLAVVYLGLLAQTLRLDAAASRAINEAARHDLHWVLTHSGDAEN